MTKKNSWDAYDPYDARGGILYHDSLWSNHKDEMPKIITHPNPIPGSWIIVELDGEKFIKWSKNGRD